MLNKASLVYTKKVDTKEAICIIDFSEMEIFI